MLKKNRSKSITLTLLNVLFVGIMLFSTNIFAAQDTPVGYWRTIDDHSGKPRSIVKIWENKGKLQAKIEKVYYEKGEGPNDLCNLCSGANHNKKILGMTIMWNMTGEGNKWSGGTILDPKIGKTYSCKLTLTHAGTRLDVRGYIGVSLLGRTQVWQRLAKTN